MCFIMWDIISSRVFHAFSFNFIPINRLDISRERTFVFYLIYTTLIEIKKAALRLPIFNVCGEYSFEWKMTARKLYRSKCTIQWLTNSIERNNFSALFLKKWQKCHWSSLPVYPELSHHFVYRQKIYEKNLQ